ncbi:MAG: DsbA family protein [Pseudoruegeria sp.]
MKQILLKSVAALALLSAPVTALDLTAMTEAERSAFRSEIRSYLLENPEVLLEAIGVLEEQQAAEQAMGDQELLQVNADALYNDPNSFVGGNPDGDITLVEFMDYRCGYCRKAFEEVEALVEKDGNIRFILKELPILGDQSDLSARFAIATLQNEGPDAYKSIHNSLMTMRGNVTETTLRMLADQENIDADLIIAAMESEAVTNVINENRALSARLNISGTPAFVLGDVMLRGYLPLDAMEGIVQEIRTQ